MITLDEWLDWVLRHPKQVPHFYALISNKHLWHAYENETFDVDDWEVEYMGGKIDRISGRVKTDFGYIPLSLCFWEEGKAKQKANILNEQAKARKKPKNWKEAIANENAD